MKEQIPAMAAILLAGAMVSCAAVSSGAEPSGKDSIQRSDFGKTPDGTTVDLYTLTNRNGMVAKIMTFGGIVTELHTPDRSGKMGDVVLGFDNLDQYLPQDATHKGHPYFGALIGRYANRIAKGTFTVDGQTYHVPVNNGPNSLHGGLVGFDKVVWKAEPVRSHDGPSLRLTHLSPDGDQGYPGNLTATVTYTLTDNNELKIDYVATTDKATPVNLTNHSYFNLAGQGDVLAYELMLNADRYTPVDDTLIPTGQIASVKGTPLDFTTAMPIGARIDQIPASIGGYDHNFVINGAAGHMRLAARVHDPASGRTVEVFTTQPGVQLYTGNFLDGTLTGKNGFTYQKHDALCLETQHFPDSPNQPNFPNTILRPGQRLHEVTVYRFSAG